MKKTALKRKTPLRAKRPNFEVKNTKVPKSTKALKKAPRGKNKPKKTITALKKRLWELCKEITRARHGYTCFTCDRKTDHPHTGHFIPSSICSVEMRYSLDNLRPQCYNCNINRSGNWVAYEERLGKAVAEDLKQRNRLSTGKQYDSLWYEAKIAEYENIQ